MHISQFHSTVGKAVCLIFSSPFSSPFLYSPPPPPYLPVFLPALQQQEQDPTNLYISNLPVSMDEQELENMLKPLGHVISTRILRDANGVSRGVGFARYTVIMVLMWHGGTSLKAITPATSMKAILDFFKKLIIIDVPSHYTLVDAC